jgi:DNA-binding transcriptional LysR family regulator
MELHQVRYFIALSNTLNFTRAAEACNVTQSALTRAIQRLEEELGGPLLQRERHLTQLSELGRLMLPLLEQSLAMAEAAKQRAYKFKKGEEATLAPGLAVDHIRRHCHPHSGRSRAPPSRSRGRDIRKGSASHY